ncbi:hypothetical protein M8R19_26605 [Pseudomonas sp. R3.Fl]|nr:hypothetical protein [Pseudomonas sp. R3.Fl]MCL6692264.1 hypothetical protein [Pseudomonas sp. R3.Fl]
MGRPRRDDQLVLNGIFWILCSGARSASALGRRCISVSVTGETTTRSTRFLSVCMFG